MSNRSQFVDRARSKRALAPAISEALEPRRMLAFIFGTAGHDNIIISASGGNTHFNVNGVLTSSADTSFLVICDEGNDHITVNSTRAGTSIVVRGENGNDTVSGSGGLDLDAVFLADFEFDGGTGSDDVSAHNNNDSVTASDIDIQGNGIVKNGSFLISYLNIEEVLYDDSSAPNRISFINLNLTNQDITLTAKGNGGNDTFANYRTGLTTAGHWPSSVSGADMQVDGGPGTDTLLLSNAAGLAALYTVEEDTIDVASSENNTGPLTYFGFESVDFLASTGGDLINLNTRPTGATLRFDGFQGTDTFIVGNGDIDTNGFTLANTTLVGGAGTDSIRFKDQLDKDAAGETESYAIGVFTLAKGSTAGFNYSSFESQILDAADGLNDGFNSAPTININALSGQLESTTINAGPNRGSIINVTQNNLINLSGTLNLNQGAAFSVVNINDQNTTTNSSYDINANSFVKATTGQTVNYSGVKSLTLNSSQVNDVVDVLSVAPGMAVTVNSGSGNDNLFIGNGDIDAELLGPVIVNGGAGTDLGVFGNFLDTTLENQVLNGMSLTDGITQTFTGVETLRVNGGPGGTNLTVNSTSVPTIVTGGNEADTFTVGGGDIDSNFQSGLTLALVIDGNGGTDSVLLNDLNDPNLNSYFINTTRLDLSDAGIHWYVNWSEVEAITLDASNGTSTQQGVSSVSLVEDTAIPVRINGNGGNDWVIVNDAAVPPIIHTGLGDKDMIDINQDFDTVPVIAVIDQNDDVETLDIRPSGTLRITNGATLVKTRAATNPGTMSLNGVLDLAGGSFLSRAGGPSLASFQTFITRGYNGGAWNGTNAAGAINSSLAASSALPDAVGYGLGSEIAINTIGGFSIAPADVLIRYTRYGDADLNGVVDFDDYSRTDNGFNNNRTGWVNGDFDFNNVVDFDDYSLIDNAFNTQGTGRPATSKGGRS